MVKMISSLYFAECDFDKLFVFCIWQNDKFFDFIFNSKIKLARTSFVNCYQILAFTFSDHVIKRKKLTL